MMKENVLVRNYIEKRWKRFLDDQNIKKSNIYVYVTAAAQLFGLHRYLYSEIFLLESNRIFLQLACVHLF